MSARRTPQRVLPAGVAGRKLVWRIRERMVERGMHTMSELHERLKKLDPDSVNYAQLARMAESVPARISAQTLLGLALVFECPIGDLLAVEDGENERSKK